jgi:LytS/YehU family sensor histidine kinase
LRTALPRLRESGSNVGAEVELVDAYLSVVSASDGRPAVELHVPPDCATARFYPMLLLPLVQRAVRRTPALPALIALAIENHGAQMRARLTVHAADASAADAAALFAHDDELGRVRARLAGLYGERAQLDCTQASDRTTFTLTWPYEPSDA